MKASTKKLRNDFIAKSEILFPTFFAARLFGLVPFQTEHLKSSRRWTVYSLVFTAVWILFSAVVNFLYFTSGEKWLSNRYNYYLYLFQVHIEISLAFLRLIKLMYRRKDFLQMFQHLSSTRACRMFSFGLQKTIFLCGLIWAFVVNIIWPLANPFNRPISVLVLCVNWHADLSAYLVVMQFRSAIHLYQSGFAYIARLLPKKHDRDAVMVLVNEHQRITVKIKWANRFFGKELLIIIIMSTYKFIAEMFYSLCSINRNDYILGAAQLQMAAFKIFLLTCICSSCENTKKTVR
ncbi:Hypothetical protein NTJ_00387 [Nesidiocoris tenuis]|uniref:Gustatory receptor n=1 Tax=Nesidiocoris tenuis TaxID=355587 RepID=A0ABN7A5T5_9HEMI|nr:Hypothetical protein NTJ_00387 [Nesidiocoris tenuis]